MQVEEARVRLAGALAEGSGQYAQGGFSADFLATQDIGDKVWVDEKAPYDAVTCMFALHYFFRSEKSARNALEMAAKNLRPGGHFFGVLPDGKNVLNAIGEDMQPREWRAVRLAPRWQGVPRPFGSAYTCALTDTVTEVRRRPAAHLAPRRQHPCIAALLLARRCTNGRVCACRAARTARGHSSTSCIRRFSWRSRRSLTCTP